LANSRDSSGTPPLIHAAAIGSTEIVDTLLQAGADINATNTLKQTALHWAAVKGNETVARNLIKAGADITLVNDQNETPLEVAKRAPEKTKDAIVTLLESTAEQQASSQAAAPQTPSAAPQAPAPNPSGNTPPSAAAD